VPNKNLRRYWFSSIKPNHHPQTSRSETRAATGFRVFHHHHHSRNAPPPQQKRAYQSPDMLSFYAIKPQN
jgi:hypothetical protein